jgi:hypothetical protein
VVALDQGVDAGVVGGAAQVDDLVQLVRPVRRLADRQAEREPGL